MTTKKINSKEYYTFTVNKQEVQILKSYLDKNKDLFEYFKNLEND